MGRKHKNNNYKYILQSNERLKNEINKLTRENECLQKMANYSMSRNIASPLPSLSKINEFSKSMALACMFY